MNDRMCEQIIASLSVQPAPELLAALRRFSAFMERREIWVTRHTFRNNVLRLTFSDDAYDYTFTLRDMKRLLDGLDRGEEFPWREVIDTDPNAPPTGRTS